MTTNRRSPAGFTLLEIVIVIAVLAILASALAPTLIQRLVDTRVEATRVEEQKLYEAIAGRPDEGTYGFVGDMGRLPANIIELVRGTGLPGYNTQTTARRVGVGWNGPYANFGVAPGDVLNDAFGRPYVFAAGQIRSAGPDGIRGNADDIVFPPATINVVGRLQVVVKTKVDDRVIVDPPSVQVRLYFSNGGVESMLADPTAPFIFENIPMGLHAVAVIGPPPGATGATAASTVLAQETVATPGSGRTKLVEIWF